MLRLSVFVLPAAFGQGPGHGISKSTYAASDALRTGDWLLKYLPCYESTDDCSNRQCTCGTQGRVQLSGNNFGIHTVYAPGNEGNREKANGGKTLQEIEQIWHAGIGELRQTLDTSVNARGWCDNRLALMSSGSLDTFISAFKDGGENYHTGTFSSNGQSYYSVLVHIPMSQVVLEIQSASCSICSSLALAGYPHDSHMEDHIHVHAMKGDSDEAATLEPVRISRAVASVDEIVSFYKSIFQVNPVSQTTASDGTKTVQIQVMSTATVLLQFVERPGQTGQSSQWFASLLNSTNIEYMGTGGQPSGCWPIWGDNHAALDQRQTDVGVFYKRWSQSGYPLWMHDTPMGVPHMYAQDPSGWQIQFDGSFSNPPSNLWPKAQGNCYKCCDSSGSAVVV